MKLVAIFLISTLVLTGQNTAESMEPYVIEVTTFNYKSTVNPETFWSEDTKIEATYTSVQPGFISRESGYSEESGEVVVVVRWKTVEDADASMQKFMGDESVMAYANMIESSTMKMSRYKTK